MSTAQDSAGPQFRVLISKATWKSFLSSGPKLISTSAKQQFYHTASPDARAVSSGVQ